MPENDSLSPNERAVIRQGCETAVEFFRLLAQGRIEEAIRRYTEAHDSSLVVWRNHGCFKAEPETNNQRLTGDYSGTLPYDRVTPFRRCLLIGWAWAELSSMAAGLDWSGWDHESGRAAHASSRLQTFGAAYLRELGDERKQALIADFRSLSDKCLRYDRGEATPDDRYRQDLAALTRKAVHHIGQWCLTMFRDGSDPDDAHWNDCFRQIYEICRESAKV
jgi:hypothetical protein